PRGTGHGFVSRAGTDIDPVSQSIPETGDTKPTCPGPDGPEASGPIPRPSGGADEEHDAVGIPSRRRHRDGGALHSSSDDATKDSGLRHPRGWRARRKLWPDPPQVEPGWWVGPTCRNAVEGHHRFGPTRRTGKTE